MRLTLVLLLWLAALTLPLVAQAPAQQLWTPADSVTAAAIDASRLPLDNRVHARYLDLGSLPLEDRPDFLHVLSGHVNGLSREPDLAAPVLLKGTRGAVVRVDIRDYGWDVKTWEKLVSPYQHVTLVGSADWAGGVWSDGAHYPPGAFKVKRKVVALAPWLGKSAADLATLTHSQAPIVSAPWFFFQTAIAEGRGDTGYYDFLGVKDQKDWEKLIRFDAKNSARLEQRRVAVFSGITQEPRRLQRDPTVLGGRWASFDSAVAQDKKNPLRVLDDNFDFEATEQISPLPNGLMGSYLGNKAGQRQVKAPDNVVRGDRHSQKSAVLNVNLSCISCHFAGKASGVIDIDAVPIRNLGSVDYDKLRELRRLYLRDTAPLIENDRRGYAAAVKEASGLEIVKYGVEYRRWFTHYDEARVDLAWAARDFGVDPAALRRKLLARGPGLDPVLSIVAGGGVIPIRQHEEALPLYWEALQQP